MRYAVLVALAGNGFGLLIFAAMDFNTIVAEVNSKRAPTNQISAFFVNVAFFDILNEHARLFPGSKKRRMMSIYIIAGFLLCLAGLMLVLVWFSVTASRA